MKTLKFMLAAATAIGIASVASAGQNMKASTGFEKLKQGDKVFTGVRDNVDSDSDLSSYFYYTGDTGGNTDDNESEIVAFVDNATPVTRPTGVAKFGGADATSRANALQVSTGTDPLLRTFRPLAGSVPQDGEEITTSTYIDTLVQFTVTPSTDTVSPGVGDKLMIYLREVAPTLDEDGAVVTVGSTNLVVMAGYLNADYSVTAKEFVLLPVKGDVPVVPGAWYRLTVEAIPAVIDADLAPGNIGFRIKLDNNPLKTPDATFAEDDDLIGVISESEKVGSGITDGEVFLSLLTSATDACTLQAVGFAGEGLVDDLVITDLDPEVKTVNFTLAFDADKVTAIEYTINGNPYWETDKLVEDRKAGDIIAITSITYADGYEFDSFTTTGLTAGDNNTFTVDGKVAASLTINAKAKAASGVEPGGTSGSYETEAAAKEAAENMVIKATAPEGSGITDEVFASYFKKVVVETADGKFSVTAELNETVVDPDATAADLAGKFDDLTTDDNSEVVVAAKPGLYYSVNQGSSLDGMKEGTRTMATGETVKLRAKKFDAGAGFYQIMVNFTDKQ